ncbi:metallo-peptidase Clan MH Family M20 [Perkinsela sp. CCAP 1560/4]|nr:metallo-peptidase Clan MH Family M20 [Perkinsela sp. CCAP 1560/4]|eukprot:KNH07721.1 metallo-peptidase Clan MH Family M20 [Perkinsela sp. CCAP 1560/4]
MEMNRISSPSIWLLIYLSLPQLTSSFLLELSLIDSQIYMIPLLQSIKSYPYDQFPPSVPSRFDALVSSPEDHSVFGSPTDFNDLLRSIRTEKGVESIDPCGMYFWFVATLAFHNRLRRQLRNEHDALSTNGDAELDSADEAVINARRSMYTSANLAPSNFFSSVPRSPNA